MVAKWARNADSPTKGEDGELLFVKPWEEQQSFENFIDFIIEQELSGVTLDTAKEVSYSLSLSPP